MADILDVRIKLIDVAKDWAEKAERRTGEFANKSNSEVFDTIYKALLKTVFPS